MPAPPRASAAAAGAVAASTPRGPASLAAAGDGEDEEEDEDNGSEASPELPERHSRTYLLCPYYTVRPLRLPVDITSLLRVVGALVVPNPQGFIVTDESKVGGRTLFRFLVRLFGSSCLGRSSANESGTWRSLTRALSQWGEKKPDDLRELVGTTQWERECRRSEYTVLIPRGGAPVKMTGTFIVKVSLKDPINDPTFHSSLQMAIQAVAPGLPPDRYAAIVQEYLALWYSHEVVPIERSICVHNRLAKPEEIKRRNLWRTSPAAQGAGAKKEEKDPLQALAAAASSVCAGNGMLHGKYKPPRDRNDDRTNSGRKTTGVDVEGWVRMIVATTNEDPEGYIVTDAAQTGGFSLWTFVVRVLGPAVLGVKPLSEANTWFALAKGITKMKVCTSVCVCVCLYTYA